jgi:hypothetical protein
MQTESTGEPPTPGLSSHKRKRKKVTTLEKGKQILKFITYKRERERERGRYAGCFIQHTRSTKCTRLSTIGKLSKQQISYAL